MGISLSYVDLSLFIEFRLNRRFKDIYEFRRLCLGSIGLQELRCGRVGQVYVFLACQSAADRSSLLLSARLLPLQDRDALILVALSQRG